MVKVNKNKASVTPELLFWARKKAGLTIDQVASITSATAIDLLAWEEGKNQPTVSQAQRLAEIYKVPFAAFFLPEPPKEPKPMSLREIIKEIEKFTSKRIREDWVLERLQQLEKRIENIIPPSTLKTNDVAVVTRKAIARMLQDILQDILGKK